MGLSGGLVIADDKELFGVLERFASIKPLGVPKGGWIRTVRRMRGLSLAAVAKRLDIHRQNVLQFEKSEEKGHILIGNLSRIAEAMECELVYAIVPKRRRTKANPVSTDSQEEG
jgi:predicted DNA-binding mobile mystery protein A